jgi:dipeptidyl aminopeptidase/acylaminoacyl peptidase
MKATDLPLLSSVSRPTLHPDGSRAVVAVSRPDLAADRIVGQLWSVRFDGSAPSRISRGLNDSNPRFSPDGRLLAFVRSTADSPGQLHVMSASGGEPVALTDTKLGVGTFCWAPDSTAIAFTAAVPEQGRYGTVTGLGSDAEPPRRVTSLKYQSNGFGYTIDRRRHVFLLSVPPIDAEPVYTTAPSAEEPAPEAAPAVPFARQLTFGDFDHGPLDFSADGTTLAVVSARHAERDDDLANNIYLLTIAEEVPEPVQITGRHRNYSVSALAYGANGELYFTASELGDTGLDFIGRGDQLYVRDGSGNAAQRLTDPDTTDLGDSGGVLTVTSAGVLVQNRRRGRVELLRVTRDGVTTGLVTDDVEIVGRDASGDTIVVSFGSAGSMGAVGVVDGTGLHQIADFSDALRASGLIRPEEVTMTGRDGYPIHGWVLTPAGEGPHPVLLNIHGGPFAQYGVSVFDEAQVYADAGYAVVMCNPRGAAGYGEAHARAIRQRLGTVDFADVIDFLDGALAQHPDFDAARVGIMGGSYGGYLTAWTIAHDHRFAGAIVERGFLDPEYFVGTSDIGSFFSDEYVGTDPEVVRAQSPQAVVDRVSTPTLVIHSANDLRCPLGQGERYFAALKRNGVPTEMLIFPGENHELSRGGRPRHRLQRFEAVLEWWSRHLPSAANPGRAVA